MPSTIRSWRWGCAPSRVPLFNAQGQVQAALNVGVHAGQMTAREMIERVLPELQKAARELTLLLR
ncbi:Pca regulon regulatory protein PcaR [Klebsiella pneumoniae]|uniref:Pca regulon regulatory protein PcaR n=1 Tax=Klebsiella pneumoniae TaxID=573 RepID=A0A2X3H6K9_KLEPN|nr:Pca regulon regulatory protein PcaR [Klebsiella pneumoniae]